MNMTPLDANESDPAVLWAEIHQLRAAVRGPTGYATWQDAATAERVRRVKAERALAQHNGVSLDELAAVLARPLLVRDVAAMLGTEVPAVCVALTTLGFPPRSTNMEVTPAEAVAVARLKALQDAAQAAGPDDSYQDEWFKAKADAVSRILALPGA